MNVTLVKHTEHDVDRYQRSQNQHGWFAREVSNAAAVPWNAPWMLTGIARLSFALFTASIASPRDAVGERLKESVVTGN